MEIMSTIVWLINRNDIIGTWCFQVLQCAVVQAFKRFWEQSLDKGYSHCHCVITLTQTFCDIPHEVSSRDILIIFLVSVSCCRGIVGVVALFLDSLNYLVQIFLIKETWHGTMHIVKYGSCSLVLFLLCFFFLCLYTLGIVLMTVLCWLCLW